MSSPAPAADAWRVQGRFQAHWLLIVNRPPGPAKSQCACLGSICSSPQVVKFLASSDSSYITGQTVYVDGGRCAADTECNVCLPKRQPVWQEFLMPCCLPAPGCGYHASKGFPMATAASSSARRLALNYTVPVPEDA